MSVNTWKDFGHLFVEQKDEYGRETTAAFRPADNQYADVVRGDVPDVPEPVVYIGNHIGKNYYPSKNIEELDGDVIEAVTNAGHSIVGPVEAGWSSWNGRPEFSDTRADFSDADVLFEADK